jgi:hypothetical protein
MKSETKYTPTPWKDKQYGEPIRPGAAGRWPSVAGADGYAVADCNMSSRSESEAMANTAYIVKCVNCHEELVAVLKQMVEEFGFSKTHIGLVHAERQAIMKAEQAIAKAEEK